ncbi:hypothetical protein ES703_105115 [subsurface metagenome]|nr:hypothetical protein [bacterium]
MSKELLDVSFRIQGHGWIAEGEGRERTTYPDIGTWLLESLKDQLRTALMEAQVGDKIVVKVYKNLRGGEKDG